MSQSRNHPYSGKNFIMYFRDGENHPTWWFWKSKSLQNSDFQNLNNYQLWIFIDQNLVKIVVSWDC